MTIVLTKLQNQYSCLESPAFHPMVSYDILGM